MRGKAMGAEIVILIFFAIVLLLCFCGGVLFFTRLPFKSSKQVSLADDKCPIQRITEDGYTITKGGGLCVVIEVRGLDYTGLDLARQDSLFLTRQSIFDQIPESLTLLYQTHRLQIQQTMATESFSIKIAAQIAKMWSKNFKQSFRTKHYIVLVAGVNLYDQVLSAVASKKKELKTTAEHIRILSDTSNDIIAKLQNFGGARKLLGDELSSYWAWLINGKPVKQKVQQNGYLTGFLSGIHLNFPGNKNYQIYFSGRKRYAAYLTIKMPATETKAKFLDKLFAIQRTFSLYQGFKKYEKGHSLLVVEDKLKNAENFLQYSDIRIEECHVLLQRLQADDFSLFKHSWILEVQEDSLQELERAVTELLTLTSSFGFQCSRERINTEACFWSRFPEMSWMNPRHRQITSANASHFANFSSSGQGFNSCSWGQHPVVNLKTTAGSDYAFTFHISPEPYANGNTLIIGGTGAGKTVFLSFLLSGCFKYKGFRALVFDRLQGLKVWNSFHDGTYISPQYIKEMEMNPLRLPDTGENRTFLKNWFEVLTDRTNEEDQEAIAKAIFELYQLPEKERTLENIAVAFGTPEKGSIARNLKQWLKGGSYEAYFNSQDDALDFTNKLITYDMSSLLDDPDILAPLVMYIFHKLFLKARTSQGGYVCFVDELPRYLASKHFKVKIETILQEVRKTNGVFLGATQDAETLLEDPISPVIRQNMGTFILFPEPLAKRKHYMDMLGLNETEFGWIKNTDPFGRQVMIKRKDGESVTCYVNLSSLDNMLKIFDSSSGAVRKLEKCQQEYGGNWKQKFLKQ
jgi:type IV secretion/conjugal transfer VirB4 family ATPase